MVDRELLEALGTLIGEKVGTLIDERVGTLIDERVGTLIDERVGTLIDERVGLIVQNVVESVVEEKMQPIHMRLDRVEAHLTGLDKDVKVLKKNTGEIKHDLKNVWDDILKLDNRLCLQEEKAVSL